MHQLQQIVTYFQSLPPSTWTTLLSFVGGSAGIATALQFLKRKLKIDGPEFKKLLTFLLGAMSLVTAASNYVISHSATSPLPTILGNGSKLLALAFVIHRFAVSPASGWLSENVSGILTDLQVLQAQRKAATASVSTPEAAPAATQEFTV